MINYEKVQSTVEPQSQQTDEYSVYINTSITYNEDSNMWQYNQARYTKDEYILLQADIIKALTGAAETDNLLHTAAQQNRAVQILAQSVELADEVKMEMAEVYPLWQVTKAYKPGEILKYGTNADGEAQLYTVIQAHNSQTDWLPSGTPALYKPIGFAESGTPIWTQPLGAHDAYQKEDVVEHGGQLWKSEIDNNVWQPGVYGWVEAKK